MLNVKNIRSGPMHFFRLNIMKWLLSKNLKSGRILDAGSGDGSLSIQLAKKGFSIYAVEPSQEWHDIFKTRIKQTDIEKNIKIFHSLIEEIKFEINSFDAIVCGEVLEHINNDEEALKYFHSLLKKGGTLILSVPLMNKGWDASDEIGGHKRLYVFRELVSLLKASGFKTEKTVSWGYPFTKLYNKFIFLNWAKNLENEEEIRKPKMLTTQIGKNSLVSMLLGLIFFIDVFFTPPDKAIGIALEAKKL